MLTIWETLPVASAAVTVMLLTPIVSGIFEMIQFEPLIDDPSDAPMLLVHVTAGAPLPPVMVPESDIVEAVVVAGGALIVSTRGPGGAATVRVTLTMRETLPVASVAVTVMVLSPIASGILDVAQFAPLIDDPPDCAGAVIQVTAGASLPPVTVPESEIVADVVVPGEASIVRASGLAIRVTLTVLEMLPVESRAVTVMVLSPIFSGILNMDQFAPLTVALSAAPVIATQVRTGVPLAPVMVPVSEIAAEVVVAARYVDRQGERNGRRSNAVHSHRLDDGSIRVSSGYRDGVESHQEWNIQSDPIYAAERSGTGCACARSPGYGDLAGAAGGGSH